MLSYAALALGALAATCTRPSGDLKRPETWGQYFLDKYAAERAEAMDLSEPAPARLTAPRTVLLITGVTVPAEWFDPIKARLERDGFRPVVYEPPDLLSGDLFWNSEQLGHVIDGIREQTGEERIDILAECTGGLIARHYIQSLGGDLHVRRLVTFISPQRGLPKAAEARHIVDWDAVADLVPGSEFLDAVNRAPLPTDVPITSIYSCTDEYIQPYHTSLIPGAKNIKVGCEGPAVRHFQFFYDRGIYNLMHSELVEPAPTDSSTPGSSPGLSEEDSIENGGCSSTTSAPSWAWLGGLMLVAGRRRRLRGSERGGRTAE